MILTNGSIREQGAKIKENVARSGFFSPESTSSCRAIKTPSMRLPRFQFSLRTLLIVVTLLAIPCGYVGWQAKIVRERNEFISRYNCTLSSWSAFYHDPAIPWIRRFLGDEAWVAIDLPISTSNNELNRAAELFPEARRIRVMNNWELYFSDDYK